MSKKLGLFLLTAGVILIPVITVVIVMQGRSSPPGAISREGYRGLTSGLAIKDDVVGEGDEAGTGKQCTVHYTGKFMDGRVFDSSKGKEPFPFQIGSGNVIKGWEEGVAGMKVGGKRSLIVPPDLAYGKRGREGIPPNSELYFEIELLKVE